MNNNTQIPNKLVFMPTWISLPSTWDESVSETEMLQGILYNVNCIIQYLEDLQTNYEEYTNNAINSLRNELTLKYDQIIADLRQHYDIALEQLKTYVDTQDIYYWNLTIREVNRLDTRINQLQTYVDNNFNEIRSTHENDVNAIYKFIESTRQDIMNFIELNNQALMEWVNNTYQDILDQVDEINEDGFRIYNPTTGEKDKVENTVNDVYDALRVFAVTAQEYDDWLEKYDHNGNDLKWLNMSALEFDTKSWWIMYGNIDDKIISPVTGLENTVQSTIEEVSTNNVITSPTTGNLTCEMWDSLEFDQNDYEVNYIMSAYDHDFKATHIFDNLSISTLLETQNGYIRSYSIGIEKNDNSFVLEIDNSTLHRADIVTIDIVSVLPVTITSYYVSSIEYSLESNIVKAITFNIVTPEGEDLEEIYINLVLKNQPTIPLDISNTNPPKPVPLGNITANEWDNYFVDHNGDDFKSLNMSAYDYDTNSILYIKGGG